MTDQKNWRVKIFWNLSTFNKKARVEKKKIALIKDVVYSNDSFAVKNIIRQLHID